MTDDPHESMTIDEFFASLDEEPEKEEAEDKYPGSRHARRKPLPLPVAGTDWDRHGYVKIINGRRTEMFTIGALAKALRRTPATIRSWTNLGHIPQAPYRLPSYEVEGKTMPNRRLYTREMVESAVQLFAARGLLMASRVEWKYHRDLTDALQESWSDIYEEMQPQPNLGE